MPNRDWLQNFAIGVVIFWAVASCMVSGDWLARSKQQPQHWYCQNTYDPQQDVIHPPAKKEDEARKQTNERYQELCQQWRSAEATVEGAHVARLQFWMGWFGIALVIGTFIATAFAAYFAYKAAEATHIGAIADQASAKTGDETLKALQVNSHRELRAYVGVVPVRIVNLTPDTRPHFSAIITNHGTTPAHDLSHAAILRIEPHPLPRDYPFPDDLQAPSDRPSSIVLHTNSALPYHGGTVHPEPFTREQIAEIMHGHAEGEGQRLYAFMQVDYTDAFGNMHWTRICVSFRGHRALIAHAQVGNWDIVTDRLNNHDGKGTFESAAKHNETDQDQGAA